MPDPSARYDATAESYDDMFGDSIDDPATAALLGLVGEVGGLRVVDVPRGSGRVARALADRGAHVTGVDLSAVLLERARAAESSPWESSTSTPTPPPALCWR